MPDANWETFHRHFQVFEDDDAYGYAVPMRKAGYLPWNRWPGCVSLLSGFVAAASAMAAGAHADDTGLLFGLADQTSSQPGVTGPELVSQAAADMLRAFDTLDGVRPPTLGLAHPTALDLQQQQTYFTVLSNEAQLEQNALQLQGYQEQLSSSAQTGSILLNADQHMLDSYSTLLTETQNYAADPSSTGLLDLNLAVLAPSFVQLSTLFTTLGAQLADPFGLADVLQL